MTSRTRRCGSAAAVLTVSAAAVLGAAAPASAVTGTTDLSTVTAADLAADLVGSGVSIANATYTGRQVSGGRFTGGSATVGFEQGVALSSGAVSGVVGPNTLSGSTTGGTSVAGDAELTTLAGATTHDAAVLEFDFTPNDDQVFFQYVFSSEEYTEYVGSYNDVFAFTVNGKNCAVIGDPPVPVSVNNVNHVTNSSSFVNNTDGHLQTQMDGLTTVLTCAASVTPNASNHLKLAIADASDSVLDSAVFIKGGSFSTTPPTAHDTSTAYSGADSVQYSDGVTLSGRLTDTSTPNAAPVAGAELGFELGSTSVTGGPTDAAGEASAQVPQVLDKPGSVTSVTTSFAGATIDGVQYGGSSTQAPFSVTKEDCTLGYTGDTLVAPTANTTLRAELGEPDSTLGDRSGKTVTFTVTDSAGTVRTETATTDASGVAQTSVALPSEVYGVHVAFPGDDFYKACASAADTLVTVRAASAKATGGGWFSNPDRVSFGFNAIPEAGGLFKGQLQLRTNNGKNRFHGATVTSVTQPAKNAMSWSGSGRWNGASGHTYTVTVVDNGASGAKKGDTISVTVKSGTGATVYSSSGAQALKGGNITVHQP